jgi:rhodanese-related sulfurtransferase
MHLFASSRLIPTHAALFARRPLVLVALGLALGLAACAPSGGAGDAVTLDMARAEHEAGRAVLIDIREPNEHATGVAPGAQLLPMRQLAGRLAEVPTDPGKPVLLICNTQNRSSATLGALREKGYPHVHYVQGGMSEWARRGWPLVKPAQ